MKVVHIESGLGNQMLSYCELIALKKMNPSDVFYIENIVYDIKECTETICQWNGYELDRIFNIREKNIRELFSPEQWDSFFDEIKMSRFWEKNWNYPVYITNALNHAGHSIQNLLGDFENDSSIVNIPPDTWSYRMKCTSFYRKLRNYKQLYCNKYKKYSTDFRNELFIKSDENIYCGQKLLFKQKGSGIEFIDKEIRKAFVFPDIFDTRNADMLSCIMDSESVGIHVRRGDLLGLNNYCYETGYFKKAIAYIRSIYEKSVFFFFCDPGSSEWVRNHLKDFGLNKNDHLFFVDWNKGEQSFRDMQLMAKCKHQVITYSSFGWWGAWLNDYPLKITCSPDYRINTTHTF